MVTPASKGPAKTVEDWLGLADDARIELIDGEFVEKAAPTFEHGRAQGHTAGAIGGPFDRRPGGAGGPGGWWIVTEVDVLLDGRVYRLDIAGDSTLTVYRQAAEGYLVVLRATAGERVRCEPFDAIELQVSSLLGDDED